jgi:ABC-type antimicrobial peptide transport system permease subunit
MQWANKNIGADKKPNPSRILLKVRNASDTRLNDYLKSKGYITNRDRLQASQVGGIIQVVMSALGVIGAFFIALSFVVFLLNFRVILAEAKAEVSLLLQLGYTTGHLAHYLLQYFIVFIGILVVSAIGALYYVVGVSHRLLTERGLEVSAAIEPTVWLIAVIFIGLTLVANVWSISRILRKA